MNKLAIVITLLFASGFATVKLIDFSNADWLNDQEPVSGQHDLQVRWVRYHLFKQTFEETVSALARRRLTISIAHERVLAAAREYQPDYVRYLIRWETGTNDDERIVNNLIGHASYECDLATHQSLTAEGQRYLEVLRK